MNSVQIGGRVFLARAPWHPIRIRLHQAISSSEDGTDAFAALCAVIGICCPSIDGRSDREQRSHLRESVIDYGECVMNKLLEAGATLDEISAVATKVATDMFDATPTDDEVDEAVDFSQAPPETFTASM